MACASMAIALDATLYAAEDRLRTSSLAMQISCSADDFLQQFAATLQPTVSLDLWGQISAALLRTGQHDLTAVTQSLLRVSTESISQLEDPKQRQVCLTSLAAISGLATSGFLEPALIVKLYTEMCVPLLAANDKLLEPRHSQIIQAFSHIVAAGSAWSSALLLLDEVAAELQTGTDPKEGQALDACRVSHPQQCLLVKSLLLSGLHTHREPAAGAADKQEVGTFLKGALQLLQPVVYGAVSSSTPTHPSHIVTLILPALCKVAQELGPQQTTELANRLWSACRQTLQDRTEGQAVALTAVVQNIGFLMPSCASSVQASDMRADPTFWNVLRQLLVDGNAFTRKQGLFILEHAVRGLGAPGEQAWQAVLRLLALLEDFALHLIKAAWEPLILQVHRAAAGSPQKHNNDSTSNGAFRVDGKWLDVVWQRALPHPSPAVQAYMLEFLFLKLPPDAQACLTVPCVLQDVMPAFCRGVLNGDSHVSSAGAFVKTYAARLDPSQGCSFMLGLLCFQTSSQAPKAAMPPVMKCAMTAAPAIASRAFTQAPKQWHEAVLAEIKRLLSATPDCSSLALSMQTDVVQLATLLCPPSTVSLASFGALLAQLPLASLHASPHLLPTAQGWLVSGGPKASSFSAELTDMYTAYFAPTILLDESSAADDADRLVRLMLLLDGNLQKEHLDHMFGHLQEKVTWLTERPYLPDHMAFRILTLLRSLIEASHCSKTSQIRAYTLQSTENVGVYLRDHALHCCQVFGDDSRVEDGTAKQSQVVVAISAAAQSTLPATLRKKLTMAHLAVATALQAFTLIASNTQARHTSSAPALELFVHMVAKLMHHVLHPQSTRTPTAHAEEICIEELTVVASCCEAVARVGSEGKVPGQQQLAGEEPYLLLKLLQQRQSQSQSQSQSQHKNKKKSQSSALRSRSQRAVWQALHSHLKLLQSLNSLALQPQTVSELVMAASEDAAAAANDVLPPLLNSLRVALEATAASPVAAHLAARRLTTTSPLPQKVDDSNQVVSASAASETSLAAKHVTCMVSIVGSSAQACWLAVCEDETVQSGHLQALLNTFASDALFCHDKPPGLRPALHGEGGPLRHLIRDILTLVQQSAQHMAAVALHLAGLFVQCPPLALLYLPEIQQLLVCDSRDISLKGSQHHQQADLSQNTVNTKFHSDGPDLAQHGPSVQQSARVAMVCLMHQLAVPLTSKDAAVSSQQQQVAAQHNAAAEQLGQRLFQNLLKHPTLHTANYQVNSAVHRAKLRHWQALAVLSAFIPQSDTHRCLAQLWPFLQGKDVASVRQYAESIIVNLVLREPVVLMHKHVLPSLLTYHAKQHEAVTSAILVGSQVISHAPAAAQEQLWGPFVAAAWPWTMWHHHAIRTFAQLVLHQLLEDFPEAQPEGSSQTSGSPWATCLAFFRTNPDMKRLEKSLGPALRTYNPSWAITPAAVLHSGSHLAGGSQDSVGVGVEGAPLTLLEGVTEFLIHQRATLRKEASASSYHGSGLAPMDPGPSVLPSSDFQRKIMPADHLHVPVEGLSGMEDGVNRGGQRQGLILVASLVDKVPNLAGLTRTCEVFRAAAMVVSDKRVTKDPAFASISVTADQWLPLVEVAEADLVQWMLHKKAQGFALVGVEQTAESVLLPDFVFPQNTVLLLGREREGIPMQLLQLLDRTVEIPQLGQIRSLNVHVSGAIALYEFSKQQLQSRRAHK